MTRFAVDPPEEVIKLVYLDAAYDWASSAASPNPAQQPAPPGPTAAQTESPAAFVAYIASTSGVAAFPEADVRAANLFDKDGSLKGSLTPADISIALSSAAAVEHPDYGALSVPVLAIYTVPDSPSDMFPWLTPGSSEENAGTFFREAADSLAERAAFAAQAPQATVTELHGVPHFLFLVNPDDVASRMRAFLE